MEPQNFHSLVDEMDVDGEEQWENMRKWVAACVVAYATHVIFLVSLIRGPNYVDELTSMEGDYERQSLMRRLVKLNDVDCHDQLRMNKDAFANLVYILKGRGLIRDTMHSSVEEQVVRFLYIVGHNLRNRKVKFAFRRSGETVSRQFKHVLRAIISLEDLFLKQPDGKECPAEIKKNCKYYPYFKDCVGAIDGSHFRVKVSSSDAPRYRGRKSDPTQNVLAACTFDLKFTYILSGWEGSASDSRILKDALSRAHDRLIVPQGKYYLVDAGFQLKTGFLAPYRSTRYHLKEYSIHEPQNSRELFNLRHASSRNSIERAFGVLKKKFPMLRSGTQTYFDVDTQGDIVLACCILHNYLMGVDPNIKIIREVDEELMNKEPEIYPSLVDECREGELLRETIANDMWRDYNYEDDQEDFTTVHDKKNLKWSDEMDKCLVDALMEQKLKGQKIGGVFTSTAYKAAATNVSSKFQFSCDSTHVKNRVKTLKKHLASVKDILQNAKPAASHFRYTPVPNYENLDEIFGKDRATGSRAAGVKQRRLEWAREQNSIEEHGEAEWNDERDKYDNNEESSTSKAPTSSKKTSDDSKKKKMRMIDIVSEEISMLTASMGEVAAAIKLGNQRNYNEEELFDEIALVGGMTEISQMTVYQKLTGDVSAVRAFHKCPTERKRLWLLVKFGQEIFDHPSA
ncbi:hypothetical protein BUALT_Bualt09G0049500 [Buddleja alternifolia]|uniref:DDE Tnp4 domain-containing protein n=1 Tax=Buddleja alternifolia TaxID=168488 RepID=A0AAV6XAW8_9LAMI|nr:hypothetical protein BUALT_Bualt09G0049500 [Buddleja alternifolia]